MQAANFARNRILRSAAVSQKSYLKKSKFIGNCTVFQRFLIYPLFDSGFVFFHHFCFYLSHFFFQVRTCVVQLVMASASANRRALEC